MRPVSSFCAAGEIIESILALHELQANTFLIAKNKAENFIKDYEKRLLDKSIPLKLSIDFIWQLKK
jgi:hypothetical protein